MGGGNTNPGDVPDVNVFATQRNDIPQQIQQPTPLQSEYHDWQAQRQASSGRGGNDCQGMVTIHDGQDTFRLAPGSEVWISHGRDGQQVTRIGSGQSSYMPDYGDTMAQVRASREAQFNLNARAGASPYYGGDTGYRNVNAGGWQTEQPYQPYQPYPVERPYPVANPVASFLGAAAGVFLGIHSGFRGGYERYGGYQPMPWHPPFIPHHRGGFGLAINLQPSPAYYASPNYYASNYAQQSAYYNPQPQYNPTATDAEGNPIYYS